MGHVVCSVLDKCRRCYHCVRECPVNAIRVEDGQARVVEERCICCGTCIRVCNQGARTYVNAVPEAWRALEMGRPAVAVLAPSFVASFTDVEPGQVVGALKELGFTRVVETAYGAEWTARAYQEFLDSAPHEDGTHRRWAEMKPPFLATTCPAVVKLVEIHRPQLIPHLVPIVSPMVATARYLRRRAADEGAPDPIVVFIGPCVAKKDEIDSPGLAGDVDLVLTFAEIRQMCDEREMNMEVGDLARFDPPYPGVSGFVPLAGGLLRSVGIGPDLLDAQMLTIAGKDHLLDLLESLEDGDEAQALFADILFCEGCIAGPLMDSELSLVRRRERVIEHAHRGPGGVSSDRPGEPGFFLPTEGLFRAFEPVEREMDQPTERDLRAILERVGKHSTDDELNCGSCGYSTCRDKAAAVYRQLAEPQMCFPYMTHQLEEAVEKLESSYEDLHRIHGRLQRTQEALLQAEKLSFLGQISAGVAHEINNPLGGILLNAELLGDENLPGGAGEHVDLIRTEAARCREIVQGLLNFSRRSRLQKERVSASDYLCHLISRFRLNLPQGVELTCDVHPSAADCKIQLDPDLVERVIVNILDNALDAVGGCGRISVSVHHNQSTDEICITITDDGDGIPGEDMAQLFTPFFTTKEPGMGTGLGLPLAHGIVKMHRGQIEVESAPGEGARVTITLPCQGSRQNEMSGAGHGTRDLGARFYPGKRRCP